MGMIDNLCDSCTNIGCIFQSGIVRTECAFYMPPHLEPDNCGNYIVQKPTTKNDLAVEKTDMIDKSNFSQEQYKADLQSAYDCGYEQAKNDLGVDCISRADAIQAMQDTAKKLTNEDTINGLCGAVAILFDLPSVTQEPKAGHWKLVQRGKLIDVCCSNCEAVRIKGYAYNYTIDELNKEDINKCFGSAEMRFCPNCGSRNEVEE